jgi:hypothetical protein
LIRLTMSKEDSAGIVAPSPVGHSPTVKRLLRSGGGPGRTPRCKLAAADATRVNRSHRWCVRLKGASRARPTPGAVRPRPRRLRLPGDAGGGFQRPAVRPVPPSLGGGTGRHGPPGRRRAREASAPGGAARGWPGGAGSRPWPQCRRHPQVRYPSLCRPAGRHQAGCPSGQRERSVKPSASPSQVRILDLPLPAETPRGLRVLRPVRPSAPARSGPAESSGVPLFAAVHGHIADSVGDHYRPIRPPDRVTSWAGPGSSMLRYLG